MREIIMQQTIAKELVINGIGMHSGMSVTMCLQPAKEDTGIIFRRIDLDDNEETICSGLTF